MPFSLSTGRCPAPFFVERTGTVARVFCITHLHVRKLRADASKGRKDLELEALKTYSLEILKEVDVTTRRAHPDV